LPGDQEVRTRPCNRGPQLVHGTARDLEAAGVGRSRPRPGQLVRRRRRTGLNSARPPRRRGSSIRPRPHEALVELASPSISECRWDPGRHRLRSPGSRKCPVRRDSRSRRRGSSSHPMRPLFQPDLGRIRSSSSCKTRHDGSAVACVSASTAAPPSPTGMRARDAASTAGGQQAQAVHELHRSNLRLGARCPARTV
jgi:hypothetical protein